VTRFSLAFVMLSDIVVVVLLTTVMMFIQPLMNSGATFSFSSFGHLGHEVLSSVSLGTTLGLLLAIYLRLVGEHLLLVLVAVGFALSEGLRYLRFDPLLTFVIAGFVIQNWSKQGPKLLHAIENTGTVVYVVFFATAGVALDLPLLRQLWPVALALCAVRAVAAWLSHLLSARAAGDEPSVRRWGWTSMLSQAGLTLGLAAVVESAYPALRGEFRSLVIATVAINQVFGPVVFKLALEKTGEGRVAEDEGVVGPEAPASGDLST
jgi:Kef-type K+ transport system membrane component KefB